MLLIMLNIQNAPCARHSVDLVDITYRLEQAVSLVFFLGVNRRRASNLLTTLFSLRFVTTNHWMRILSGPAEDRS